MIGVLSLNSEILASVQSLDQKCNDISSGLLFSDSFVAKMPSGTVSDEMEFWYAVTNLYGLFYDCAPYLFRVHNQFGRCQYSKVEDGTLPKTLMDILADNGCLTNDNKRAIKDYISAIKELRTCFCHNKPLASFDNFAIKKSLGPRPGNWIVFPYLGNSSVPPFNYTEGLSVLQQKTRYVFGLLSTAISKLALIITEEIIEDWSCAIVAWYMQSDDVMNRCLRSYFDRHPRGSSKHHQVNEWKKQLANLAKQCGANGKEGIEYLLEWRDDLRDNAFASQTRATAELILADFFDDVLDLC